MTLTVLGSGTSVPDVERGPCGLLVQTEAGAWLVDGGSGTLQRCARAGVDPRTLTGGVYSHHHPDHCADLVPLLFSMRVGPPPRERDYPIWAAQGFSTFLTGLQGAYGRWIEPGRGIWIGPAQQLMADRLAEGRQLGTQLWLRRHRRWAQAAGERLEVEATAPHQKGDATPLQAVFHRRAGDGLELLQGEGLIRRAQIEQMVGHPLTLFCSWLRCADVHPCVQLPRIHIEHLELELLRQIERQGGFAAGGGSKQHHHQWCACGGRGCRRWRLIRNG